MKLSVIIPANNEEACLAFTVTNLSQTLKKEDISYEILVINDNSTDKTEEILIRLSELDSNIRYLNNTPPNGFGFAVRRGLEQFKGDAVAIYMADASDDPGDLVIFFRELEKGYDCIFGTRWSKGGRAYKYPPLKKILNRLGNYFIMVLMGVNYDDFTNAFKLYRKEVIWGIQPILSNHFNLTVEIPLKAIIRGYSFKIVPNKWTNRTVGISKLKIKEMGSRYVFIVLYCFIEKSFFRKNYYRRLKRN